ncbi:hypothetical protein AX14_008645, partial [Amanita brunnescens Koide BX004]
SRRTDVSPATEADVQPPSRAAYELVSQPKTASHKGSLTRLFGKRGGAAHEKTGDGLGSVGAASAAGDSCDCISASLRSSTTMARS